jgi:hypothetical protein
MPFPGFTAEDFDAYLPEKWSSNMFTLPRRRVKDKLEDVGRHLPGNLAEFGLSLVQHLSDDHPTLWNNKKVETQWLFYSRDELAQKQLAEVIDTERTLAANLADPAPLYRHVFLGVAVDQGHLEIGLRLHHEAWVDRKNALTLLAEEDGLCHFLDVLASLPGHYEIGLVGEELAPVGGIDIDRIRDLAARFDGGSGFLFIGARLPRDQVLVLGPEVLEVVNEALRLLAPVYRFVAWSPENDAVSLDNLVARRQEAIHLARDQFAAQIEQREARRAAEQEASQQHLEELEERTRIQQEWRARERLVRRAAARTQADVEALPEIVRGPRPPDPPEPHPPAVEPPAPRPPERPARQAAGERPRHDRPPRVATERASDVRVGDRVEVGSGFLKGRMGIVQEIDDRGGVRIAFGSLSSRLERADVVGHGPAQGNRG